MFKNFLKAIGRDWISLVTGGASIPLTVLAFWADTPLQRTAWATFAIVCFIIASFRNWAFEYRRAEAYEERFTASARPWVIMDDYSFEYVQYDDIDEEHLSEKIRIVNRGQAPAVNITIPDLQFCGSKARVVGAIPTLGPGESTDVKILNLCKMLEGLRDKLRKSMPESAEKKSKLIRYRSLLLPCLIEYRSLDHRQWSTNHAILFQGNSITFSIVSPNDSKQWTDLSVIELQPVPSEER